MNPNLLLRVAAVLTFAHAMLNTFAGLLSGTSKNQAEVLLLDTMKALHFDAMGSLRTYWDFYFGFGLFLTVNLLLLSALMWRLASVAKVNRDLTRPFIGMLCIAFMAFAILSWFYFFIAPVVMSGNCTAPGACLYFFAKLTPDASASKSLLA